jgi:hypothetical protein
VRDAAALLALSGFIVTFDVALASAGLLINAAAGLL